MKNLLLKFTFKDLLLLIIIILLIGVSIWAYNADELQIHAVKSYVSNMRERVTDIDVSAFEEFIFVTAPNFLNRFLLKPFISLLGFALGGAFSLPFIPQAMKEHFTASPRRVVSFFFLMFLILHLLKFLAKLFGLDDFIGNLEEKAKNFIINHLPSSINVGQKLYEEGKRAGSPKGYGDGKHGKKPAPKNLEQRWYETHNESLLSHKLKRIRNYALFFILVFELMLAMSADPNFNLTDFDSPQPDNITINNNAAVSSGISN